MAAAAVDIEGMAAHGDDLLLGFKAPLLDGKAVILRIAGADGLFSTVDGAAFDASRISIWKALDLRGGPGNKTACGIADLIFSGEEAYLLSAGTAGSDNPNAGDGAQAKEPVHVGELWHLPAGASQARRLKDFGGKKPEGIALLPESRGLAVAFDNGSKNPSRIEKMEIPR